MAHLEFLMVFMLMFFLLLGGFEFARYLRVSESISQISREVAKQTFRECLMKSDIETPACIQKIIASATTPGAIDYLGLELVVSIWRADPAKGGGIVPVPYVVASIASSAKVSTRFPTITELGAEPALMIVQKSQIQLGGTILYRSGAVIVEASIPYGSINSQILPFVPAEVHEVTMF